MSFEVQIPKKNLKIFAKALQAAAKIGTELIIETTTDRFILRTLNNSQSAYVHFSFLSSVFFNYFTYLPHNSSPQFFKCKIHLKNFLLPFRSIQTINTVTIIMNHARNELKLCVIGDQGIKRTYGFAFEDQTSILQADFSRTTCPNHIISPSKLFSNVLANFSSKAEEMTIIPTQVGLTIRSYFDVNATSNKVIKKGKLGTVQYELNEGVQTEYSIDPSEFESYQIADHLLNIDTTFSLTEFRAILQFCDAIDQQLLIYFERGGRPMLLTNCTDDSRGYIAEIVLATMQDESTTQSQKMPSSQQHNSQSQRASQSQQHNQSQRLSQQQRSQHSNRSSQSQSQSQHSSTHSQQLSEEFKTSLPSISQNQSSYRITPAMTEDNSSTYTSSEMQQSSYAPISQATAASNISFDMHRPVSNVLQPVQERQQLNAEENDNRHVDKRQRV